MNDINFNISSKLLEKIIDASTGGISALLKPLQIKRLAKAEAEADSIKRVGKAKTDLDIQPLEQELKHQIAKSEVDYQEMFSLPYPENGTIEQKSNYYFIQKSAEALGQDLNYYKNIVLPAAEMTKDEDVSDEPINDYWLKKHKTLSQDVSDEDMQKLWARILSEEVKKPESVSIAAMQKLSTLSKSYLNLIAKAATLEIDSCINEVAMSVYSGKNSPLGDQGLSLGEIHDLNEEMLLNGIEPKIQTSNLEKEMRFEITDSPNDIPEIGHYRAKIRTLSSNNSLLIFFMCPHHQEDFEHNRHIPVTKVGKQLMKIANVNTNPEFVEHFAKKLKSEGFTDHFVISKLPTNGHIELETIIDEMLKNNIDFDRYRVDPSEGEDTPS